MPLRLTENICDDAQFISRSGRSTVEVNSDLNIRIQNCHHILRTTFGHSVYKGKQKEIIGAAVAGRNVFVLAPTGMGKSLCFQIPAIADKSGMTVIISPLLSLMKNQIDGLRRKGVVVAALSSETSPQEKRELNQALVSGHPGVRLLYTTPETLSKPNFMKLLRGVYEEGEFTRLVIDEAHCISEWGHDFREDYRRIGDIRQQFPDVPVMALTATAAPDVIDDIIHSLRMTDYDLFIHPVNRYNLYYEVRYVSSSEESSKMAEICDYICDLHRKRGKISCGIIYCRTKKTCNSLSGYLRSKGLAARPYHRDVSSDILAKTFEKWSIPGGSENGGIDIVVATIAFGLGIDKGDVRYIIHYDIPKSFEGYYQETGALLVPLLLQFVSVLIYIFSNRGRAGRNGAPSKCILYYSREDLEQVRRWVHNSHSARVQNFEDHRGPASSQRSILSLKKLAEYAENTDVCRHISICRFFGENVDEKDSENLKKYCDMMCDVCKYPEKTKRRKDKLGESSLDWHTRPSQFVVNATINGTRSTLSNENGKRIARTADHQLDGSSTIKKLKMTECGIPLVTKPHSSAASLLKPFKTPSILRWEKSTSPIVAVSSSKLTETSWPLRSSEQRQCRLEISSSGADVEAQPISEEEDSTLCRSVAKKQLDGSLLADLRRTDTASSELSTMLKFKLPEIHFEIEDPGSCKVPAAIRYEAVNAIRQTIHRVFVEHEELWGRFENPPSIDKHADLIASVSTEIEYGSIFCFSCTPEGYQERIRKKMNTLALLGDEQSWKQYVEQECYEDAHEAVEVLRQLCH